MINAKDLISLFQQALDEKWGYIWGKRGQIWTQAQQNSATREQTIKWGSKWIGKRVADCSGLFVWAFSQLGGSIYHGSNTIFNKYISESGGIFGEVSILPGTAVFLLEDGRRPHIGLYIGDGKVIEARGTNSGVVESDLARWDEWGLLRDVDYSGLTPDVVMTNIKTMKKGSQGVSVKWLQEKLLQIGYDVGRKGADGIFGSATKAAVEAFQLANGLEADGVAGKKTLAALTKEEGAPEEETPEDNEPKPWGEMTTSEKLEDLNRRVLAFEKGGDSIE